MSKDKMKEQEKSARERQAELLEARKEHARLHSDATDAFDPEASAKERGIIGEIDEALARLGPLVAEEEFEEAKAGAVARVKAYDVEHDGAVDEIMALAAARAKAEQAYIAATNAEYEARVVQANRELGAKVLRQFFEIPAGESKKPVPRPKAGNGALVQAAQRRLETYRPAQMPPLAGVTAGTPPTTRLAAARRTLWRWLHGDIRGVARLQHSLVPEEDSEIILSVPQPVDPREQVAEERRRREQEHNAEAFAKVAVEAEAIQKLPAGVRL